MIGTAAKINALAEGPWQTWGRHSIRLLRRTVAVDWIRSVVNEGDEVIATTIWRSDDVPGGLVKYTITHTRRGRVVFSMERRLRDISGDRQSNRLFSGPLLRDPDPAQRPVSGAWRVFRVHDLGDGRARRRWRQRPQDSRGHDERAAANGCATPDGGAGTVTVVD